MKRGSISELSLAKYEKKLYFFCHEAPGSESDTRIPKVPPTGAKSFVHKFSFLNNKFFSAQSSVTF